MNKAIIITLAHGQWYAGWRQIDLVGAPESSGKTFSHNYVWSAVLLHTLVIVYVLYKYHS